MSVLSSIVDIVASSVDCSILKVVVIESFVAAISAGSVLMVEEEDMDALMAEVLEGSTEDDVVGFEIGFMVKSA